MGIIKSGEKRGNKSRDFVLCMISRRVGRQIEKARLFDFACDVLSSRRKVGSTRRNRGKKTSKPEKIGLVCNQLLLP